MTDADDQLIARYRNGDAAAFERLYHDYAPRLLGFVMALGASRDAAEDVAQKTWMRIIDKLDVYQPRGRFRAWLFRSAWRLWRDEVRSAWERKRISADSGGMEVGASSSNGASIDPVASNPRQHAISAQERERIGDALHELAEPLRQTVLLRIDGDLTYREIADAMDCPIGTALWRMKDAERRLRRLLAPQSAKSAGGKKR